MILLGCTLVAAAGCGPIEYISVVALDAQDAIDVAIHNRADQLAPYEYTAAQEYLHKARELGAYARFEKSVEYGRKAKELAEQATIAARDKTGAPRETPTE